MFGKSLIRLIGYVVTGVIVLAAGAELLSSIVSIVLAFRSGNLMPLSLVIIVTVLLALMNSLVNKNTPIGMVLNIAGYAATGYLAIVAFVIAIPYGLVASIIAAVISAAIYSFIRNPINSRKIVTQSISQIRSSELLNGLSRRVVPIGDGTSFTLNSFISILILEECSREKIIQLMRERPLLSISFTHYVGCDVLFIVEDNDSLKFTQIMKLLKDYNIRIRERASPLLAEAIQMIPIIDSKHGLSLDDYRLTMDELTIARLLALSPPRLTVFPTTQGLGVLVPNSEVPGLNVERLRRGQEYEVLLHRNYTHLQEVEEPIESTT